jgi:hypothetical protein
MVDLRQSGVSVFVQIRIFRVVWIIQPMRNALRRKTNFFRRFNVIWVVQSRLEKYFVFRITQITSIFPPSRPT